jgi:putative ABC transport system permease protein
VSLDFLLIREIGYAGRSLRHSPGLAAVAIVCLGLGIGINTAIFSIIDGILLKPYPYDDPGRIVVLGTVKLKDGDETGVSVLDLRDWKAATKSFTTIAAVASASITLVDGAGEPERYQGAHISWDLWRLLGIRPILGRDFVQSDDQPNAAGVVLLSHMLWTTRYRSDPKVVGHGVDINGTLHTIVGVMPPNFAFPNNQRLWVTLQPGRFQDARDARYLFTFGRLRPGVTQAGALEDLNSIAARLAHEHPATNDGWSANLRTLQQAFVPDEVVLILELMMAGVTLVLFIACSNVANLLLVRATVRRRELAVRVALGAGRGRIVVQLLTEALVLALASVPIGLVLAALGSRLIRSLVPPDTIPYYVDWSVDSRSLAYSLAVAVSTALAFGLVPALQVTRRELQESLKEGGRGMTSSSAIARHSLVVSQVALALVALVGASLFVRSFNNLDSYELGFDTTSSLTLRFFMAGDAYQAQGAKRRRVEDIVRRVEALPGVEAAFASNLVPIQGGGDAADIEVEGRAGEDRVRISIVAVTPHVLRTLDARVRHGRDLSESDSNRSVAVISEAMAKRVWPAESPVDRRFRSFTPEGSREWITVIGIAPDMRLFGIDPSSSQAPATAFVPYTYSEAQNTGLTIRAHRDPAALAPAVRAAIRDSDPRLPVFAVRTLEDLRRFEFWQFALYGWIFGTIGVIGVMLASIGVYGVLAYSVSQRTHEIGVRVTLGASRTDVVMLVVGHGLSLTAFGIAIGVAIAAFGAPLARSLLYDLSPFDPLSFILVPIVLVAVALAASYVPARRAMRIEPVAALRQD